MRSFKRIFFLTLAAVCLRAQAEEAPALVDSIQAVVNDAPITQQNVERVISPDEDALYRQYYATQPETYRKLVMALRVNTAEFLIAREVILHDFKETIKVPESIIEEIVQDRITERWHGDRVGLIKQLEADGVSLEDYKQRIREQWIVEQMRLKNVPDPIISPRKIENYYLEHRDDYKLDDQVKMRMIVLNKTSPAAEETTRKRAEEILTQIKAGASFEELARSYSEGSLRAEGGETGWEELAIVNKALLPEINKLKPGEYSGVIEAPDGYYLLLLEGHQPSHYKPLNDVRAQIESTLVSREIDRLQKEWIDRLKKKTFVKYF